jgi:hypothetical protein
VCDERNGWLTDETVTNIRKMGAINIANMIIDCLEMDDDSRPDLSLGGVADAPVMFQIRESGVLQLGIVIDITASITSLLYQRTRRSSILLKV